MKLQDTESLGGNIVVQGGTMRNDSVVRAFEQLTGVNVARSNMPEMMGAYGCALFMREEMKGKIDQSNTARNIEELLSMSEYETRQLQCHGCENSCMVSRYTFPGGAKFYSGNKCERVFNNQGEGAVKGENLYVYKYQLLFQRECLETGTKVIGIPRALNMYENYPFGTDYSQTLASKWCSLLNQPSNAMKGLWVP